MMKLDKEKKLIEYMNRIIDNLSTDYQIKEVHALDIRNQSTSSKEFSFEEDLIHDLVFKCDDDRIFHVLIKDPYEPFHDDSIISIERVPNLNSFHIRISYSVKENRLEILDDDL